MTDLTLTMSCQTLKEALKEKFGKWSDEQFDIWLKHVSTSSLLELAEAYIQIQFVKGKLLGGDEVMQIYKINKKI